MNSRIFVYEIKSIVSRILTYLLIKTRVYTFYQKVIVLILRHRVKTNRPINIVFIATNSSQWKYQSLYNRFQNDNRFNPIIILVPVRMRENEQDYIDMRNFFESNNVEYIDYEKLEESKKNIRKYFKPDILFYVQPYYHIYDKRIDSHSFKDKLIIYAPYCIQAYKFDWGYNLEFHEYAWKLFYNSQNNKEYAIKYALNKGKNVNVVGYLTSDVFFNRKISDVWKSQKTIKKKVIWTPHHSIFSDSSLNQSSFLQMSEFMLDIADEYKDIIQFSFKPHPELKRILSSYESWGEQKTNDYYLEWESRENTQYDYGEFYDLFLTSDALINDSASFSVEYLYTKKPAINCYKDLNVAVDNMMEIGSEAVRVQYYGTSKEQIKNFLESVVLEGNDPKKILRDYYYDKYLLPPNKSLVVDNIYQTILSEFQ